MKIMQKLREAFKTRDHAIHDVMYMFYDFIEEKYMDGEFSYPSIVGHYMNDGGSYIVMSDGGKLYRSEVTIQSGEVSFTEPVPVEVQFVNLSAKMKIVGRDSKGRYKFVVFAASTVLNRDGEIDSRDLFDSFERSYSIEERPVVTVKHVHDPSFYFGTVHGVTRLNNLLICHGFLEPDHPLTTYAIDRFGKDEWGISIGFFADDMEVARTVEGIEIPVYKSGRLIEISVLREDQAASYFTGTKILKNGVDRMAKTKEQLKTILLDFTGDEAFVDQFLGEAELRERTIEEQNLITRSQTEDEISDEAQEVPSEPDPEEETEQVVEDVDEIAETEPIIVDVELTDEALREAISQHLGGALDGVLSEIAKLSESFAKLEASVVAISERSQQFAAEVEERFAEVEREDGEKVQDLVEELPINRKAGKTVVFRPSLSKEVSVSDTSDLSDVSAENIQRLRERTLSKMNTNIIPKGDS